MQWAEQAVLVTGAGGGLGSAIARPFAGAGRAVTGQSLVVDGGLVKD